MQGKITIVVVGYNRADAMERVLHSLSRADETAVCSSGVFDKRRERGVPENG